MTSHTGIGCFSRQLRPGRGSERSERVATRRYGRSKWRKREGHTPGRLVPGVCPDETLTRGGNMETQKSSGRLQSYVESAHRIAGYVERHLSVVNDYLLKYGEPEGPRQTEYLQDRLRQVAELIGKLEEPLLLANAELSDRQRYVIRNVEWVGRFPVQHVTRLKIENLTGHWLNVEWAFREIDDDEYRLEVAIKATEVAATATEGRDDA